MKDLNEGKAPCARRFSEDFKRNAVRLVLEEGYTHRSAAEGVGVSEKSLRDWHARLAPKPEPWAPAVTPAKDRAS